ncbi:MAG: histone deacetylase [Burkholderiales bacterium]|nr:histone deacetylase [Burkholderiales bacterium]
MNKIPVAFDPRMAATTSSFSPSAAKPAAAVLDWSTRFPLHMLKVRPASEHTIALAHDLAYVRDVLAGRVANGFGNTSPDVAASLPYTVGSMLSAARFVMELWRRGNHSVAACSPTSGFHHAHFDRNYGYCTFNGLMVTAVHMLKFEGVKKVGILDFDHHHGDGTQDIIDRLRLGNRVMHYSAGAQKRTLTPGEAALQLKLMARDGCELVLYQAGADQHVDDPLGGRFTSDELSRRDRLVFRTARDYDIPLVWNLAGGYQRDLAGSIEPVLAIHRQTMQGFHDIYLKREDA